MSQQPAALYVIFHKYLVPEFYNDLSDGTLQQWVHFIGVNSAIRKEVPAALEPLTLLESQLPWYNPFLQLNRFCESSVFYHVWRNQPLLLREGVPYVGFFHYDMELRPELFDILKREIGVAEAAGEKILFPQKALVARPHISQLFPLSSWDSILYFYNKMFNANETIYNIADEEIPLYHSFVLHRDTFKELMSFVDLVAGRLFEMSGGLLRHWPFQLERLHGIFLALHTRTGRIARWVPLSGAVLHRTDKKDPEFAGGANMRLTGV